MNNYIKFYKYEIIWYTSLKIDKIIIVFIIVQNQDVPPNQNPGQGQPYPPQGYSVPPQISTQFPNYPAPNAPVAYPYAPGQQIISPQSSTSAQSSSGDPPSYEEVTKQKLWCSTETEYCSATRRRAWSRSRTIWSAQTIGTEYATNVNEAFSQWLCSWLFDYYSCNF